MNTLAAERAPSLFPAVFAASMDRQIVRWYRSARIGCSLSLGFMSFRARSRTFSESQLLPSDVDGISVSRLVHIAIRTYVNRHPRPDFIIVTSCRNRSLSPRLLRFSPLLSLSFPRFAAPRAIFLPP